MANWLRDKNGNKCSVEYFGSKKAAQNALDSLINCKNCTNCSDCSDCYGCSDCFRCSYCSNCSGCSDCFRCYGCSDCFRCSYCSDCSGCSDCFRCSGCSGCFRCSYCLGCSGCSDCSDCSGCFNCSGCSGCSLEIGKTKKEGSEGSNKPPVVPVITDLHKKVYEAVTAPDHGFDMSTWHTCDNTHCRGGWVVHLAGDAGRALEKFYSTELAAMLIYDVSCPGYKINPSRFYDSNEDSLADMKRLAEAA